MTNKEINDAIHKFRGVKNYHGDLNSLSAVCYFFLMDSSYQLFVKKVRPIPHRHIAKKMVSDISAAYNAFFERFFAAFDLDQRDYLNDKAEEMEQALEHHIEVAKLQMMNCCIDETPEIQDQISDVWMCNRLAYEAMRHYGVTWKSGGFKFRGMLFTKEDRDKNIEKVVKLTKELSKTLYGDEAEVKEKHLAQINLAMSILTKKIASWVIGDYKQEIQNDTSENQNREA